MSKISNIKLVLFFTTLAVLTSELLIYTQLQLFWSETDNHDVVYIVGFFTPLITAMMIISIILYIKSMYEKVLKESESRFHSIIENSASGILATDIKNKKFTLANPAICNMLGYTKEQLLELRVMDIHPPEDIEKIVKDFELQAGVKGATIEYLPMQRSDGTKFYANLSTVSMKLDGVQQNIGIFDDVTKRYIAEQELKNYKEHLEQLVEEKTKELSITNLELHKLNTQLEDKVNEKINELRKKDNLLIEQSKLAQMGEMLNMIAHQWRQPLNALSASAINLSLQSEIGLLDKEKVEEASKFIQEQAQKMSKTINDFMEFNKTETDKEFYLLEAIDKTVDIVSSQLKSRSIDLQIDIDKNIKVFHNIKAIEHVLLNLISNARDAFDDKDINDKFIKVSSVVTDTKIELLVEDNAGGISEDVISKVFNPYFTTKEQGKGTGIGLYMSKQMVETVNGSNISVKNTEPGALFSISFEIPKQKT